MPIRPITDVYVESRRRVDAQSVASFEEIQHILDLSVSVLADEEGGTPDLDVLPVVHRKVGLQSQCRRA